MKSRLNMRCTSALVALAAKTAVWHELRKASVSLPIERKDGQMTVTVPSVGAWNGGWIGFE